MIKKIYTPSYTSNDDVSKISRIHFKNGEKVKSGKTLFTLENSKTSFDLEADEDGFYYTNYLVSQELSTGDIICILSKKKIDDKELIKNLANDKNKNEFTENYNITESALKLIKNNNIDPSIFKKDLITENDVSQYINSLDVNFDLKNISKKNSICIVGTGGFGETAYDTINDQKKYSVEYFVDYINSNSLKKNLFGKKILSLDYLEKIFISGVKNIFLTTKDFEILNKIIERAKKIGYEFPNIISPKSYISETAIFGEGIYVGPNSTISTKVQVGSFSKILNNVSIGHHTQVGQYSVISDNSAIAANCEIGSKVEIGLGANVINKTKIGNSNLITSGQTVIFHVPEKKK